MTSRSPHELRPHPLNRRIYGDEADDDLVESVRERGILTPLVITEDDVVISGHRRLDAAKKLGLHRVPVLVSKISDKTEVERALIHANEQRQRTVEQKIREYKHLKTIEERLAKQRQVDAGRRGAEGGRGRKKAETLGDNLPKGLPRRAGAVAAKPFKMSYKTLDRGVKVVEHIDSLIKEGNTDEATRLRAALTRSISRAFVSLGGANSQPSQGAEGAPGPEFADADDTSESAELPALSASGWAAHEPTDALALLVRQLVGARACFRGEKKPTRARKDPDAMRAVSAALEPLVRELRRRRKIDVPEASVPVYGVKLGDGVRRSTEFEKKGLARYGVNIGLACSHQCVYCSTPAMNRTSLAQLDLGSENLGYAVVDPTTLSRLDHDLPGTLTEDDVVMVCTTVDAWAPEGRRFDFGRKCVLTLLTKSPAQVRILTKNAALRKDLEAFLPFRDRVMIGLSTGVPASREDLAKFIEPHASPVTERLAVLAEAHELGFRTYGMLCPCLPGVADTESALEEMFDAVLACGVEAVWLEPVNERRGSIRLCADALDAAEASKEAAAVRAVTRTEAWSAYVLGLIRTAQRVARERDALEKLRVLLYPKRLAAADHAQLNAHPRGIVWLDE